MMTASEGAHAAVLWLKRLWPLLLLFAAGGLVLAMGWHRYLTLQELAENRGTLRGLVDANMALSLAAFIVLYAATDKPPEPAPMTQRSGFSTSSIFAYSPLATRFRLAAA